MTEREEKNRLLATWLGWRYVDDQSTLGFQRVMNWKAPNGRFMKYPPDFFTSESASAMLLEKMPFGSVCRLSKDLWVCRASEWSGDFKDTDRKTAIAEAALALIDKEPRP